MDRYAALFDFARPAWPARQLWRVFVMLVAFEVVFFVSFPLFAAFLPSERARMAFYEGTTPFGTLAQLAAFGVACTGFVILLRLVHGRGFWSLVGPYEDAIRDLIRVTVAVGLVRLVIEVMPPWIAITELEEIRAIGTWIVLVPITLAVLLIQVGTEELFFRGYLQQQLACVSAHPLVWMVLPSALFGALHFWNGNGAGEGVLLAIWATTLGMACADLTARSGNIGAAVGLHLANNAFALLIVGVKDWPSSGVALFLYPYEDPELYCYGLDQVLAPWAIFQLIVMLLMVYVMWLAARIALQR